MDLSVDRVGTEHCKKCGYWNGALDHECGVFLNYNVVGVRPVDTKLTDRERWLMSWAFNRGKEAKDTEKLVDILAEALNPITVEDNLANNAPNA